MSDAWPGNVRELENALERGVVLARGKLIGLDDLLVDPGGGDNAAEAPRAEGLGQFLERTAAERIRAVLAEAGGVRVEAAPRLGVDRTTLYRLMRKYGIDGDA